MATGQEAHKPFPGRLRANRHMLLLVGIWLAHVVVNTLWIHHDASFRSFDGPPHLDAAAHAAGVVRAGGVLDVARGTEAGCWPSAGYLTWALPAMITGTSIPALRTLNLIFLGLLIGSVFAIGRRVHSRRAGVLAAALVTLYPALYGESRQFGVDFAGTAITAAGVALLLQTARFSRLRSCLLLGLTVGLGVLLRPQICFFLAGPTLFLLASAMIRPGETSRPRTLINVAAGVAVAAAASAVWWWSRLDEIATIFLWHQSEAEKICEVYETSALFYVKVLPACFSATLLAAAAVGLGGHLTRGARPAPGPGWLKNPRLTLVLAWLVMGFTVLSYIRVNHMRYMLPLAPALALLTAVGMLSIRRARLRQALIGVALAVASVTLLVDSHPSTGPVPFGLSVSNVAVTSGPPQRDSLVVAADQISDHLIKRHGDGQRLTLRLAASQHITFSRIFWLVSPVLRTRLPGVIIRFHPPIGSHEIGQDGKDFHIGCAYLPFTDTVSPRQTYTLVFDHDDVKSISDIPNRPTTRLLYLPVEHHVASAVSLWR